VLQVQRNEECIRPQKFNSFAGRIQIRRRRLEFHLRFISGSANWEPSRGVAWCRPFSSPAFSTYNGESARSARWAEVGTHHPRSEKPPLLIRVHPHYMLAAPSTTVRARATHLHAFVRSSWTANPSQTHTYAAPRTRYRKAEIDNAGGPPAPYPNTDTRPAVAPGPSRRRDGALPSSLLFGFCAEYIRPVPMQQINPTLRIHTCALDAARMLALLGGRWCATIFFLRTIIWVSRNLMKKKILF